jgi:hypothetical protein
MNRKEKKDFRFYLDNIAPNIGIMTDEEAGQLLKACIAYWQETEYSPPRSVIMAFNPIKAQFDIDWFAYIGECEKNKENGKKGGRPPKPTETQINPNNPVGY